MVWKAQQNTESLYSTHQLNLSLEEKFFWWKKKFPIYLIKRDWYGNLIQFDISNNKKKKFRYKIKGTLLCPTTENLAKRTKENQRQHASRIKNKIAN